MRRGLITRAFDVRHYTHHYILLKNAIYYAYYLHVAIPVAAISQNTSNTRVFISLRATEQQGFLTFEIIILQAGMQGSHATLDAYWHTTTWNAYSLHWKTSNLIIIFLIN